MADAEVASGTVGALRTICAALPDAYEEPAWVGTRWRVRGRTFAHVVAIADGRPPAFARAVGEAGPLTVVTFRSSGEELDALGASGRPYFVPPWWHGVAGIVLDDATDWDEVGELLTESYCLLAPKKLVARVLADDPRASSG